MICVELSFTDEPARLAARPAHRDRLRALHEQGALLLAGPWDDDSGALLVFTGDRAEVDRLLAEDPYFTTAGVRVVAVRGWRPVVGPGRFAGGSDGGTGGASY
ncbi:YciI family protein [Micromonospora sp. C95]|uniref:YciI family protein n=1 Tax=Micromonospora sp. C95 TaxID=2824882 RepID=UPI001B378486|nr:YciI family protein [Micromonospora sp. C95]MBQ1028017.1 hypothetical protein [Micromonospora sp. C95]